MNVRIIPLGIEDWWISWDNDRNLTLGQDASAQTSPLILNGRTAHSLQIDGRQLSLPMRTSRICDSVRFAVLGDGRAHIDGVGPSAYWNAMLSETKAFNPQFILNTGDLVKNGERVEEWNQYLRLTPAWPPMVPVRGNHDRGGIFEKRRLNPGPVFWFRTGPIAIIGFDTEAPEEQRSSLMDKLDRALASVSAPWRLVFLHRPVYSRGRHGSDERGWNADLIPIFDRHGVHLVIAGHDHNYERFCPSTGVGDARRCIDGKGTTYVVTGGAATFTTPFPGLARSGNSKSRAVDSRMSRVFSNAHHFLMIDASPSTLRLSAYRTRAGNLRRPGVFDEVFLTRSMTECDP